MKIENKKSKIHEKMTICHSCLGSPFLASEDGVLGGVIVLRTCRCSAESDSSQDKQTLLGKLDIYLMCVSFSFISLRYGKNYVLKLIMLRYGKARMLYWYLYMSILLIFLHR